MLGAGTQISLSLFSLWSLILSLVGGMGNTGKADVLLLKTAVGEDFEEGGIRV